jgi:hypothetical protein
MPPVHGNRGGFFADFENQRLTLPLGMAEWGSWPQQKFTRHGWRSASAHACGAGMAPGFEIGRLVSQLELSD